MISQQIGAALKARLAALTFAQPIPVAWPGKDFTPSGRYIAAQIDGIPNERLTVAGHHRIAGLFLLAAVIPAGKGTGEADGIADAIAAHFPVDLRLTLTGGSILRVTAAPSIRGGFLDGAWWRVPVSVPFEVLTD